MKNYISIIILTIITLIVACQKEQVNPSIEGTYLINNFKALERYEDPRMCLQCGPIEIFPSKIIITKTTDSYNLEIIGEHYKPNSVLKEPYSHLFKNVVLKEERNISILSFKGQIIGSIETLTFKGSDLIFEVNGNSNPIIDTKYTSIIAKKELSVIIKKPSKRSLTAFFIISKY